MQIVLETFTSEAIGSPGARVNNKLGSDGGAPVGGGGGGIFHLGLGREGKQK
jgi:hypothetical protein